MQASRAYICKLTSPPRNDVLFNDIVYYVAPKRQRQRAANNTLVKYCFNESGCALCSVRKYAVQCSRYSVQVVLEIKIEKKSAIKQINCSRRKTERCITLSAAHDSGLAIRVTNISTLLICLTHVITASHCQDPIKWFSLQTRQAGGTSAA